MRARARGAGASARAAQARKLTVARHLATAREAQLEAQADRAARTVSAGGRGVARGLDRAPAAAATVARSAGRPLAPSVQTMLERGFGADLREVRIHRDPDASAAAHALRAHAFTAGRDIYLADAPELDTPAGHELLAHEAAHVLQQTCAGHGTRLAATDRTGAGSVQMAGITLPAATPRPHELVPQAKPAPGPIPASPARQQAPPLPELHAKPAPAAAAVTAAMKPTPPAHDPARAVELARRSPCVELPHRAEVEHRLKISTHALQVHIGPEATAACRLLDASAFTVHNVIVFAEANPPLSRVLHEVAHVIQQGALAGAAPDRYDPGTLAIAAPGSQPEREAAGAARGTPKTYLTSAKPAVYRDKKGEPDPGPMRTGWSKPDETEEELALREMIKKVGGGKYEYTAADAIAKDSKDYPKNRYNRYGVPKADGSGFEYFYNQISEPWTTDDLGNVIQAIRIARGDKAISDDYKRALARNTITNARETIMAEPGVPLWQAKYTWKDRLFRFAEVKTWEKGKEYFKKYILVGNNDKGIDPGPPKDVLGDSQGPAPPMEVVDKLRDYRVLVERIILSAGGGDPGTLTLYSKSQANNPQGTKPPAPPPKPAKAASKVAAKDLKASGKVITDAIDALLPPATTAADAAPSGDVKKPTETDASTIRKQIIKWLIAEYTDAEQLHAHVVDPAVFEEPYFGIQGAMWVEWASENWEGGKFDPKKQPMFRDVRGKKHRYGDGFVQSKTNPKKWWLVEGKAWTTGPDEIAKDQAGAYREIVEGSLKGTIVGDKGDTEYEFDHVQYLFSSRDIATKWVFLDPTKISPDAKAAVPFADKTNDGMLRTELRPEKSKLADFLYTSTPDPIIKAQKFTLGVKKNPVFNFEITDPDKAEHDFKNEDLKVKPPGVTLIAAHLVLENPGVPKLKSGTLQMSLEMGKPKKEGDENAFVTKDPPVEKIEPIDPDLAKASKEQVAGTLSNKPSPMKSGLDKILKRIRTDAKLVDNPPGITASVSVVEGDDKDGIFKGFDLKPNTNLTAKWTVGMASPTLSGTLGILHKSGKFDADLNVLYDGEFWTFSANADVKELFTGLQPFHAAVKYTTKEGGLSIEGKNIAYVRTFNTIKVTGSIGRIAYESATNTFIGENIALSADIGSFATATVKASVKNTELTEATLEIDQNKPFKYPKTNSILTGTANGSIHWKKGETGEDEWDGHLGGKVTLKHKLFDKVAKDGIGVDLSLDVDKYGSIDGSVTTTTALTLGKHFSIPSITLGVTKGKVHGEITASIINIKKLQNATATVAFDDGKITLKSLDVALNIGDPKTDKFYGSIALKYDETKGLGFLGEGHLKIKNYMVNGTVEYWTGTDNVTIKLWTGPITLLKLNKDWKLYELKKQIKLVSFYNIIGIYLDVGFDLRFKLDFSLSFTPTIYLIDFNLDTHEFKSMGAHMLLEGLLTATLSTTPYVGLGVFVIDPRIVRGGGGIMVPISAVATAVATGDFGVEYDKQGNVIGSAKLAVGMWFEIYGDVKPYAEFVVLDGQYTKRWEGESLKHFTILPKRELFTWKHDFNTANPDASKEPKTPEEDKPAAAPKLEGDKKIEQDEGKARGAASDTKAAIDTDKGTQTGKPDETEAQDEGGFDIKKLLGDGEGLKSLPLYKSIAEVIDSVGRIWQNIKDAFWNLIKFFKKWFDKAVGFAADIIKKVADEGSLFGALKFYLQKVMPEGLYDVLEPLLSALTGFEKSLYAALESSLPSSFDEWLTWGFRMAAALVGAAWDNAPAVIAGLRTMFGRAATQTRKFVNYLISERKLGVKKDTIKTYVRVHIAGIDFYDEGYTTGVVAAPMWAALKLIGATPTDGDDNFWA